MVFFTAPLSMTSPASPSHKKPALPTKVLGRWLPGRHGSRGRGCAEACPPGDLRCSVLSSGIRNIPERRLQSVTFHEGVNYCDGLSGKLLALPLSQVAAVWARMGLGYLHAVACRLLLSGCCRWESGRGAAFQWGCNYVEYFWEDWGPWFGNGPRTTRKTSLNSAPFSNKIILHWIFCWRMEVVPFR